MGEGEGEAGWGDGDVRLRDYDVTSEERKILMRAGESDLTQLLVGVSGGGVNGVFDWRFVLLDGDVRFAMGDVGVVGGLAVGDVILFGFGRHGVCV